jgi:asparagine synthase (glutamine-hydrolysing)
MVEVLGHRGPDNASVLVQDGVGLGHTRLSIIDVSHGADQPFRSADGRYAIVYNGEVYNFPQLRQALIGAGIEFLTASDTEVLLNAFIHWGRDCLGRINGMFAFVIYDFETCRLFGARDRFGIKPFTYAVTGGRLIFASEIKALLKAMPAPPPLDTRKAIELFMYRELIQEHLLREIRTLEPGHWIELEGDDPGRLALGRWFHVSDLPSAAESQRLASLPRSRRLDTLDQVLHDAVARHLISDVPVGSLCSGGVDSSLMTALACRSRPDVAVYHVDVQGVSERQWAEKVARHLDIDLNFFVLDQDNYLAKYIECIWFNDYPLTHPQNVPIFYISELARQQGCKVLLTGEGADEGFGGYDWRYRLRYNYRRLDRATQLLRRIHRKIVFAVTGVWLQDFDPNFGFRAWSSAREVIGLTGDQNFRRNLEAECRRAYGFIEDPLDREVRAAMTADLRDYVGGILHQQDRASMQASIESRVPFLDIEVARIAANLPLADKITRRESKRLLKELALRYLPRDVVFRPKVGFASPASSHVLSLGTGPFEDGFLVRDFGFALGEVKALLARDPGNFAHMLYGLEFWGRMFVWGETYSALQARFLP